MNKTIITLINLFWLKASPSKLPASYNLLVILLVLNFAGSLFLAQQNPILKQSEATIYSLSSMFTYVLLIWLVLRYRQLQNRFLQTASALFGVDLLILILQSLVVLVAMTPIIKPLASLLSLLTLIALVWQFFVKSYILGQALNIGRWLAFLVILLCLFIASFIGFSAAGVNVMERVQKLTEQMTQSNNLPASKPPTEPAQQSGLISS